VLALEAGGVSIEGVVRFPFETNLSWLRVVALRASSPRGWQGVQIGGGTFAILEERANVASDGRFHLAGLDPGEYELQLESEGLVGVLPCPIVTVTAPASGVELGSTHGRVRIVVSGGPERGAALEIAALGASSNQSLMAGKPVEVIADRRAALTLSAKSPGFQTAQHRLPAGRAAVEEEIELVLEPDGDIASLELSWTAPAETPELHHLVAHFRPLDPPGDPFRLQAEVRDGRCRLADRAPGRYALNLEPRTGWFDWMESFLFTSELEVELLAGRSERVEITWSEGGRARFQPAGRQTRPALSARVHDSGGREVAVRLVRRELASSGIHASAATGFLPDGPSELEPNLPPGNYVLVLSERDVERRRVPFTIVAGAVVDVPFELP
jgi:hypothetical protein